jgi:asparagine synthase (glutamine-hydrolysing)
MLLEAHRRGEADRSREIWTVLVFCLWYAAFVEQSLDPGVPRNSSALLARPRVASTVP